MNRHLNDRSVLSFIAVCSALASASHATDGVWERTGSNTPETAYLWNAEGNWADGKVPADGASVADFFTVPDASSTRYVYLPGNLSLKSVKYGSASGSLRLIGDGCIDLYDDGLDKTGQITDYLRVYSDVRVMSKNPFVQFKASELCGDLRSSSTKIVLGSGPFIHRLDLYANKAGSNRISPMGEAFILSQSFGELRILCPESSATNNVSSWTLAANSRIARRVGGGDHALPVGTFVSASNGALPDGCFLKRIYDRDLIELSEAATADGETGLTFAALSQKYEQSIAGLESMGTPYPVTIMLSMYREEDEARLSLGYLDRMKPPVSEDRGVVFDSETAYPGTIVLKAVSCRQPVVLKNCHIEFAGEGLVNPAYVRHYSPESYSRMTVTNGLSASITCLSNVVGRLVKDGAGILSVTLPHSLTEAGDIVNTGTVSVEDGILRILADGNGTEPAVKNMEIGAKGEVRLADGVVLTVGRLTAESGAVVSGKGVIMLAGIQDVDGVILRDGARIETDLGVKSRERVVTSVEAKVVGTPAFWVDASKASTMEIEADGDDRRVKAWHDCRENEADFATPRYLFATNVADVSPKLIKNDRGEDYAVDFAFHEASESEIEKTEALVWSAPVSNIKAVFKVLDPSTRGGTCVLGQTKRLSSHSGAMRRTQYPHIDSGAHILHSSAGARKCVNFLNGERVTRWSGPEPGYPVETYTYSGKTFTRCVLHEIWNTNGVDLAADAFGYSCYTKNANGIDRICECLVYTNELTYAERLQVAEYLTRKWCGGEATYDRFGGVSGRIGALNGGGGYHVGAEGYAVVDRVGGSGTFTKTGAGAMYVDDLVAPELGLKVAGGTLTIRSVSVARESLPQGAYLHLDASDAETIADAGDGVAEWRDWRGADHPAATPKFKKPAVKSVAELGGRNVVDFGDFHMYDSSTKTEGKGLQFAALDETRSVFFVYGSARGGGNLIGGSEGDWYSAGLFRGEGGEYGANPSSPLISTVSSVPRYVRLEAGSSRDFGGSRFRRDGVAFRTGSDGFGGKYEVISLVTPDAYVSSALSLNHYAKYTGGQDIGEAIVYERALSEESVKFIEAYLRNKWFGDPLPCGYRRARVASLDVAEGATVTLCGNAPLTVGTISGAGVVDGAVSLDGGELTVTVPDDGSAPTLTLGAVRLDDAVTVRFCGAVKKLAVGEHVLIVSASIRAGDPVSWPVDGLPVNRRCVLRAVDGALVAQVCKAGMVVHVR